MTAMRYPEKFTNVGGTVTYTFPLDDQEYEPGQAFRVADTAVMGADYAHDLLGGLPWLKSKGVEPVRFTVWAADEAAADTAFNGLISTLLGIGMGKLWTLGADGSRRWAYAKLAARPSYRNQPLALANIPVELQFERYSDWRAESATTGSQALAATPVTWTITITGRRVVDAVWRLRASSATGFTNPELANLTNGYSLASSRDAATVNSEIKIDGGRHAVLWSDDDGATYANDYSRVTQPATAVALMALETGSNSMRYTDGGTPNATLEWSYYEIYE